MPMDKDDLSFGVCASAHWLFASSACECRVNEGAAQAVAAAADSAPGPNDDCC